MQKILFFLFFSVVFLYSFELSKEQKSYIQKKQVIYISNELDWYPYDFNENGIAKGYCVDYMKLLAKKAGLKIEFVSNSWKNLLLQIENGSIDILLPVKKTTSRENEYIFGHKILEMKYSLITKNTDDFSSLDNIVSKKVALVKSWASSEYIKTLYPKHSFIEFDTSLEALEAVAFGVADANINDYYTAQALIHENMLSNLVVHPYTKSNLLPNPLYIMAKNENKVLIDILDGFAEEISKKELVDLKAKWNFQNQKNNSHILDFSDEEKNYLKFKKSISMCIDPDWMPLEKNDNGKHIGMTSDYFKILEEKIGIPIRMVNTKTWGESIEFAKARKCDIYSLAMATPERKLYMNFTVPYLKIPLVLVTRNNQIFYSDISAIKDKKIGVVKGYAYGEILHVKYPSMQLVHVENLTDGLNKVEKKELFGLIGTLATVGYNIQKNYLGSLQITGKFDEYWELGVATRNDEPMLLEIFNKAIQSIDVVTHQEILNRWISVNYEKPFDYKFVWQIAAVILLFMLFIVYRQYELKKHNKELEKLSKTDTLTKIYNRLKLDEILEYEVKNQQRYLRPLSVVLIDIDDFKMVNDEFGHSVGDRFLIEFSNLLQENMRSTDSLGRWGGEEFLLILPETDLEGAHKLAQKLKEKIETYEFEIVGKKTSSFGVAQLNQNETKEMLFDRVDKALYSSKTSGKNRVTIDL